ncbi:MAG: retroviral-like aspartic protease family protein [Ignavibacteria bacterium]|nr:retroviral-like aspartic protease family protein [Ignavibacteria bacterium]
MKHLQLNVLLFCLIIVFINFGSLSQTKQTDKNEGAIIIPLDLSSQRPVVELSIDGEGPYRFIFDTGSSGNVIDKELASKLNLEITGENRVSTPGSENVTIAKTVKAPLVSFEGSDILKDADMTVMELRVMLPVDGVLSANFFSDYLITLDYPNSKLMLNIGQLNESDKDVISFVQNEQVINIYILIDGKKIEAHLDSGNPGMFDIPFSLKDEFKFKAEPKEAGTISTPVASFKTWGATLDGEIKIGGVTYRNPGIHLVEGFLYANVGYRILKDLKTTIDKKNNLIKFEKSSSTNINETNEDYHAEENEFTGLYGGGVRRVLIENGEMYLQRGNAPKLKLVKIKEDIYEMVFSMPVNNELPNVRFERDESDNVTGLTFMYLDGREEFVEKDN